MDLNKIQKEVHEWTSQFKPQYWSPLEMQARLTEEIGEVARELNDIYGHKKKKPDENTKGLGQELSDVIFTVCCIANSHNINLQNEWQKMMNKYHNRDNERFDKI